MRNFIFFALITLLNIENYAQECPYKVKPWVDIPVTLVTGGTAILGLAYLNRKPSLDSSYIATLKPEDVNRFDRSATRQRSSSVQLYADIGLFSSILAGPVLILANHQTRKDALKVGLIYLETMMIMANVYTWTIGSIDRNRPYLYNPNVPIHDKLVSHTRNSFFAGHPAAAAASTFFIAKTFHDYNQGSKWRKYVWAAALVPPAVVAYCRYRDGQHFPTDIIVGIPLGAAVGIFVPHLHCQNRKKNKNLSFFSTPGGVAMIGRF